MSKGRARGRRLTRAGLGDKVRPGVGARSVGGWGRGGGGQGVGARAVGGWGVGVGAKTAAKAGVAAVQEQSGMGSKTEME